MSNQDPQAAKRHTAEQVAEVLLKAERILVISHYNPDGDAYSSSTGLALALTLKGKTVCLLNESPNSERYFFIPGVTATVNQPPAWMPDVVAVCDCGDIKRVGDSLISYVSAHPCVVNIDHHVSNTLFGSYNLLVEKASSACEIVYQVVKAMRQPLTKDLATCLLTGLVSDTGSFRYASTTADTLRAAAELKEAGAELPMIAQKLFEERSLPAVLLQSYLLSNIRQHANGKVVEVFASEADVARFNATLEDLDGIVEEARAIAGVVASTVIRQDGEIWRVSMRAKDSRLDLSTIAQKFGGGGHRAAAAFRWKKSLEELRSLLLPELERAVDALSPR